MLKYQNSLAENVQNIKFIIVIATITFSLLLAPMLSAPSVIPIYASPAPLAEQLSVPCTAEMTAMECWTACPKGLQYWAGLYGKYNEYDGSWTTCSSCNGFAGYCYYWACPDGYILQQGPTCGPALPPCEPPGVGGYIPNLEECIPVPKTGNNQTDPEPQPPLLPPPPTSPPQGLPQPQPTQPERSSPMPQPKSPDDVIVKQRQILGVLKVNKVVTNDDGGSKKPSDFTIHVTGNNPSPSSFRGTESGTTVLLDPGEYRVTETLDSGYSTTYSSGCGGTIAVEQKICNILNNDKTITVPPQLLTPNATIPELGEGTEIPQPEVAIPCLPEEGIDCEVDLDTSQPEEEEDNDQSNNEYEQESQESPVRGDGDQKTEENEN